MQPNLLILSDLTGTDSSHLKLNGLLINSEFFPDVVTLGKAWDADKLKEEFNQTRD